MGRYYSKSRDELGTEVQAIFQMAAEKVCEEAMTTYESLRWFRRQLKDFRERESKWDIKAWELTYTTLRIRLPVDQQIDCLIPLAQMYLTEGVANPSKRCITFQRGFKFEGCAGTLGTRWLQADLNKWTKKQGSTHLHFKGYKAKCWPKGLNSSCAIYQFGPELSTSKHEKHVIRMATEEMTIPDEGD